MEYDLFGVEISHFPWGGPDMPNDTERIRQVLWLVEQGFGQQVLLSHDVCFKIRLTRYGERGSGTSLAGSCRAFDSEASPRSTSGR